MILGLSHVAVATDDVERSTSRLLELGYSVRFDEPAVTNHVAKRALLSSYQPTHHIRSFAAKGAMALELLYHGSFGVEQAASLIPVFNCSTPFPDWQMCDLSALPIESKAWSEIESAVGQRPRAAFDPKLQMTLLWITSDEPMGLRYCVAPCQDTSAMGSLLRALRFNKSSKSDLWSLLTPISSLEARIVPVQFRERPNWQHAAFLDARGCSCIALMAKRRPLYPIGALQHETSSFDLVIRDKSVRISMARTSEGLVVEIVEQGS